MTDPNVRDELNAWWAEHGDHRLSPDERYRMIRFARHYAGLAMADALNKWQAGRRTTAAEREAVCPR